MLTSVSAAHPCLAARQPLRPLTDRQRAVWEYVAAQVVQRGGPPSIRDIMRAFEFGSPNAVVGVLRALFKKGWLEVGSAMEARSFRVPGLATFLAPAAESYLAAFRLAEVSTPPRAGRARTGGDLRAVVEAALADEDSGR